MAYSKESSRLKRKIRIRKKIQGSTQRPRLTVFRSTNHFYAQIIDDTSSSTIVNLSTKSKDFSGNGGNVEGAKKLGALIGKLTLEKGIKEIVFDRNGYLYHGRIKAFADAVREQGLNF